MLSVCLHRLKALAARLPDDLRGATMVEYALIASIICAGLVATLPGITEPLDALFISIGATLTGS